MKNLPLRSTDLPNFSGAGISFGRFGDDRRKPAPAPRVEPVGRLLVRRDDRLVVVRIEEIDWVESAGNYVRLHVGGVDFLLRHTLAGLASQLDPERFVKVHRRAIVNLDSISEVLPGPTGEIALRLSDGTELTVSRRHRRRLLSSLSIV
ncbi:MAG: LytR/AlgR family response regulator transcription factor [Thermoanaerobaculia bacterium]